MFPILFVFNSVLLGIGLAMDAFAVSLANGLAQRGLPATRSLKIAGIFALFQAGMPLLGWFCVHNAANAFSSFQKFIPWIALALLLFLGLRMVIRGIREKNHDCSPTPLHGWGLLAQGLATSIDALSVGFTIAKHTLPFACVSALLIGLVTFVICLAGVALGKRLGTRLAGKATILGGILLILIGIEIAFFG